LEYINGLQKLKNNYNHIMNNEQKAVIYGRLLNEHTRLQNEISSVKGESFDLNTEQRNRIKQLEMKQIQIMNDINRLLR